MYLKIALSTALISLSSLSFAEDACRPIVAATVAELKAGAASWDRQQEAVARAAAGAACVKALSGNYAGNSISATDDVDDEGERAEAEDDDSWWPFDSVKRNKVSASPSSKPYERKR